MVFIIIPKAKLDGPSNTLHEKKGVVKNIILDEINVVLEVWNISFWDKFELYEKGNNSYQNKNLIKGPVERRNHIIPH